VGGRIILDWFSSANYISKEEIINESAMLQRIFDSIGEYGEDVFEKKESATTDDKKVTNKSKK
jgi:hypothetical protein